MQTTALTKTKTTFGVSEEVEEYIDQYIMRLVARCQRVAELGRKAETEDEALEDAVGRLAMSALRSEKQHFSIEYLKKGVRTLGCMRSRDDLAHALGLMLRNRIPTILNVEVILEHKTATKEVWRISIQNGTVGLPDASYYKTKAASTNVLFSYLHLLKEFSTLFDLGDLSSVSGTETQLAEKLDEYKDQEKGVVVGLSDLERRYSMIPWRKLFEAYGIESSLVGSIEYVIDSPDYLTFLDMAFEKIPLEEWYSMLSVHTMLHAAPFLPHPYDSLHYSLFDRLLRGQKQKLPQPALLLRTLKIQMSTQLSYLFVRDHLSPEFKTKATAFVKGLVDSAIQRLHTTEWMQRATRKKAAEKVRNMKLSIGYFQSSKVPTIPFLQTDNFLTNIYLLESNKTQVELERLFQKVPQPEWDEPAYSVNAYYYEDTNELIVPAGSFFWPFFDFGNRKGLGWNYGGLGAIIGHELTHAFDEGGKEFNEVGLREPWWTSSDQTSYEEKTKELIHLFEQSKILGKPINGSLTLDENLADLGGLGIALEALKEMIKSMPKEQQMEELRQFFESYAVSWRTKERPERTLQRLLVDSHAPPELRVNNIVIQFDEWYDAFGVQARDGLYIPPEERIRIF
jgi:putative endopeptidase